MSDSIFDSEAPEPITAVHDLAEIKAKLLSERTRNRHLLVRMNGSFVGQVVPIDTTSYVIGRAPESEIWVHEEGVSRLHARVERTEEGVLVTDLGSANGSFVGGQRIERHVLKDGDLLQVGSAVMFRYCHTDAEHERMLATLYEASVRDPLTGAYNREHLDERLNAEISYAKRHKTEVGLIMFDLDLFKSINDTYGHPAGDQVLVAVCKTVHGTLRLEDVLARYGGEEFAVVLRNIPLPGVRALAERLRERVAAIRIRVTQGVIIPTASFGGATLAQLKDATPTALVAAADRCLLEAKRRGRDRVVI